MGACPEAPREVGTVPPAEGGWDLGSAALPVHPNLRPSGRRVGLAGLRPTPLSLSSWRPQDALTGLRLSAWALEDWMF